MNKTMTKYIAKYVFGEVKGLRFNKRNLKIALENSNYRIFDVSLYGYKFIEKDGKIINCSLFDIKTGKYKDFKMTLEDFWRAVKGRKKDILLIEDIKKSLK